MISKIISGKDVEKNKDAFILVDVRSPEEFKDGHIQGAINIPFDEILDNLDKLDKDSPTILYCRSNQRAEFASLALKSAGYEYIYIGDGVALYDYDLVK
ncbi:rhodanese-like domain-containing protein [uncultured Anaerococcus sp.]|uniref:rhodanese-like domain-containing protein n=1 Tax=uncultured Anaerococcus sp. TaxID=293428 RepID=UPI00261220BB|nr:rhodanese-like domain-containing protein [uncultured Anaerococcus sp.]